MALKIGYYSYLIFTLTAYIKVKVVSADCGLIDIQRPWNPYFGCIVYTDSSTDTGSEATFWCQRGFRHDGPTTAQCNGQWGIPVTPSCKEYVCPHPDTINHGHINKKLDHKTGRYSFGSAYSAVCDPGYEIKGPPVITCLDNGTWSDDAPTCEPIFNKCQDSNDIAHGVLAVISSHKSTEQYPNTTIYSVICNSRYHLKESSILICQDNGEWSKAFPSCELIENECQDPHCPIIHGRVVDSKNPKTGRFISYYVKCDPGYIVKGSSTRICQEDGRWSDSTVPTCEPIGLPIRCGNRDEIIDNGRISPFFDDKIIQRYPNGTGVIVLCDEGYQRKGPDYIICLESGTWSDELPICEPKHYTCAIWKWLFGTCFVLFMICVVVVILLSIKMWGNKENIDDGKRKGTTDTSLGRENARYRKTVVADKENVEVSITNNQPDDDKTEDEGTDTSPENDEAEDTDNDSLMGKRLKNVRKNTSKRLGDTNPQTSRTGDNKFFGYAQQETQNP